MKAAGMFSLGWSVDQESGEGRVQSPPPQHKVKQGSHHSRTGCSARLWGEQEVTRRSDVDAEEGNGTLKRPVLKLK